MNPLRCYVVDDEELPLSSLVRMLHESGRADVIGYSTDPAQAVEDIKALAPDALFLDIHMPDIDGFRLLQSLPRQPLVVFTTAYDQHAVRAFEVNSVDYLLKPVGQERLANALLKLERQLAAREIGFAKASEVLASVAEALKPKSWLKRIGTQSGENVLLLDVSQITHFVSEDRYTYACTERGRYLVSASLSDLESRLDPSQFLRIHRSAIVNLRYVDLISRWFAGRVRIKLRDRERSELTVSRDKVRALREALGLEVPSATTERL